MLSRFITNLNQENIYTFLEKNGLLKLNRKCKNCNFQLILENSLIALDGKQFKCNSCHRTMSLRQGTIFEKSDLPLDKIMVIMYTWAIQLKVESWPSFIGLADEKIAIDWCKLIRKVCKKTLSNTDRTLGGPGHVVQVLDTFMSKAKNSQGQLLNPESIFAMYDVTRKRGIIVVVNDRSGDILLPIIEQYILPDSIIHSDAKEAYDGLAACGYTHMVMDGTRHFKNPENGVHTNNVKAYWSRIKRLIEYQCEFQEAITQGHVYEAEYRDWFHQATSKPEMNLDMFMKHISEIYVLR